MEWTFVNICTVVGAFLSLFGFGFTLWQLYILKKSTEKYQKRIEAEVSSAQQKIKSGLAINNVMNVIKILGEAIEHINQGKYDIASLRLGDIEPFVEEIINDENNSNSSIKTRQTLKDYRDVMTSLITNANQTVKINRDHVLTVLTGIRTTLVQINANLKKSLYGSKN